MRAGWALGLALFIGCAPSRPPEAPLDEHDAEPLTPETSPIGLRRSVVADEYFWLRAKVLEGDAPKPFKDALSAMQELRGDLSSDPTSWEDLEVPLGSVRSAADLSTVYGESPTARDVAGRPVMLRARALRLSKAIEATETAYRAGPFREHEAEIQRAAKDSARD